MKHKGNEYCLVCLVRLEFFWCPFLKVTFSQKGQKYHFKNKSNLSFPVLNHLLREPRTRINFREIHCHSLSAACFYEVLFQGFPVFALYD